LVAARHILRARSSRAARFLLWHLPALASLVVSVLIGLELLRFDWALRNRTLPPPAVQPEPAAARSHSDERRILAAHLFGVVAHDPSKQPAPSTAGLLLSGVIATQDPAHGVAIIGSGAASKLYSVGHSIDGASLQSVFEDHVILDRGGHLETLLLPRAQIPSGRPVLAGASRPDAAAANARTSTSDGDPAVEVPNLTDIVSPGAAVPSLGKMHGFRLRPGNYNVAFSSAGLRSGDVVVAIDGTRVEDMGVQSGRDAFARLKGASGTTLTIERDGETRDVTIDATQYTSSNSAAADAAEDPIGSP